MDCVICGGNAKIVTEQKQARYRGEVVEVTQERQSRPGTTCAPSRTRFAKSMGCSRQRE